MTIDVPPEIAEELRTRPPCWGKQSWGWYSHSSNNNDIGMTSRVGNHDSHGRIHTERGVELSSLPSEEEANKQRKMGGEDEKEW